MGKELTLDGNFRLISDWLKNQTGINEWNQVKIGYQKEFDKNSFEKLYTPEEFVPYFKSILEGVIPG